MVSRYLHKVVLGWYSNALDHFYWLGISKCSNRLIVPPLSIFSYPVAMLTIITASRNVLNALILCSSTELKKHMPMADSIMCAAHPSSRCTSYWICFITLCCAWKSSKPWTCRWMSQRCASANHYGLIMSRVLGIKIVCTCSFFRILFCSKYSYIWSNRKTTSMGMAVVRPGGNGKE